MLYNNTNSINKTTPSDVGSIKGGLTEQGRVSSMSADIDSTSQPQTKQCSKCKQIYPATTLHFSRKAAVRSGLMATCHNCNRVHAAEYYATHREEILAKIKTPEQKDRRRAAGRKFAQANRDTLRVKSKELYRQNPESVRARIRKWRQAKPEKMKEYRNRRRALEYGAEASFAPFDEQAQLKRQQGKCYYCQNKLTEYHIDHVIPLSRGGSNHPDNKVLACPSCNLSKNDKLPHEWAKGGRLL